jgi:hypothetical protein
MGQKNIAEMISNINGLKLLEDLIMHGRKKTSTEIL